MSAPEPNAPSHERLKQLFGEVCDLATPALARARLDALQATADECAQVLRLLAHDDGHTAHLSAPVKQMMSGASGGELKPGTRLGAWTLVRELGEGGMGRVFEARRSDGLYEQRSAIKVLQGFSSPAALVQLAQERQLLATLNHPNIARLFDGGTTPAGHPYLVMEHVDGMRIDEHVRQRNLGLVAVIDLFLMVCDAVAYAHRRQVVHCDIKPGNVLVDDEGRAKLLDFGIAQLEGSDAGDVRAMTPRYASPEQRAGRPATAASDVYSLGRLLDALLQVVEQRGAEPIDPRLQAAVAVATAESLAVRFADVRSLAGELHRFLDHRERDAAIAARHQAQQEAAAKGQVTEFVLSLFRAADPLKEGHPDARVSDILARGRERIDLELKGQAPLQAELKFVLADVYDNIGQPGQAMELFEQALALERTLVPLRRSRIARLLSLMAQALAEEGHRERALAAAQESHATLKAWPDAPALGMAGVLSKLGWIEGGTNRFDDGRRHLHEALDLWGRALPPLHRWPAVTRHNLGQLEVRAGNFVQAERELHHAMQTMQAVKDLPAPVLLTTREAWAACLVHLQRAPEAVSVLMEAVARRRALTSANSVLLARTLNELSTALRAAAQPSAALAAADEAVAIVRAHHAQSPNLARFLATRAMALDDLGDPAAGTAYLDAQAVRDACPRIDAWVSTGLDLRHGRWLAQAGHTQEAEALLWRAVQERRRTLPDDHIDRFEAELEWAQRPGAAAEAGCPRPGHDVLAGALAAFTQDGLAQAPPRVHRAVARARAWLAQDPGPAAWLREAVALTQPEHTDSLRLRLDLASVLADAHANLAAAGAVLAAVAPALTVQHADSPLRARAALLQSRLAELRAPAMRASPSIANPRR